MSDNQPHQQNGKSRLSPEDLAKVRRRLLDRGQDLATALEGLLSGKDETLATIVLPQEQKPGETNEDRVRAFMAMVKGAITRLHNGEYGTCLACGTPLAPEQLLDMPWLDRCASCTDRPAKLRS